MRRAAVIRFPPVRSEDTVIPANNHNNSIITPLQFGLIRIIPQ